MRRPEERIRIAIRHHLETLGRDRSLAIVAQVELRHSLKFMSLLSQQEVADYLNMLRKMIEHGQSDGSFRRTIHPQLGAKAVFGILDEMVTSWILSEKEYDLAAQRGPDRGSGVDGVAVGRRRVRRCHRCAPDDRALVAGPACTIT